VLPEGDCCLPFLSGACLLVRRSAFEAVGGFDPAIFLFYEDDDLCRRLRDAGHALVHVDAAQARHGRGKSTAPSLRRRYVARWHLAWSRAHVGAKYGQSTQAWRTLVLNTLKALGYGLIANRMKAAAHAGSAAGALAWLRGRTALARQRLD
jgi:GT2 family glycosyltransferase